MLKADSVEKIQNTLSLVSKSLNDFDKVKYLLVEDLTEGITSINDYRVKLLAVVVRRLLL